MSGVYRGMFIERSVTLSFINFDFLNIRKPLVEEEKKRKLNLKLPCDSGYH